MSMSCFAGYFTASCHHIRSSLFSSRRYMGFQLYNRFSRGAPPQLVQRISRPSSSPFSMQKGRCNSVTSRSSMSSPTIEYGYIDGVEQLSDYRPGGYHPVEIGHRLHERYRIVHKLGHGTFSTAWLALDERNGGDVAVKVGTADADMREVEVLSQLATAVDNLDCEPAGMISMIPAVVDRFNIDGPNGTHFCFVSVPARCTLMDAKEASGSRLFQLDVARSIAAQLAMAISLVHSQGYAHGDLHLGNLLLMLPSSLNHLSVDELYAKFGAPEQFPVVRLDGESTASTSGVPPYAVPPVWLGIASDEIPLSEAELLLGDFGVAFRPLDESRCASYTPLIIRPPEAFFEPTTPLSFKSDIWSLGCIIFELLAHRSLIDGIIAPQDEITAQQVHLQGPMPAKWWDNWEHRSKWFDQEVRPLSNDCDIWTWERRFEQWVQEPRRSYNMSVIDGDEKIALFQMLQRMLAWTPSERLDADEVLGMDWMKNWALPAYEKSWKNKSK